MLYKKVSDYYLYVNEEVKGNLCYSAFLQIEEKLENFVDLSTSANSYSSSDKLSWVLNAPMGHGKTTALTTLMKILGNNRGKSGVIPLLLVFPNNDAMMKVVHEVREYGNKNYIPALVAEVNDENVSDVVQRLSQYQFVCITQQRFRDLALHPDN